ncbi:lysophospholipid acyltransferase family protein [Phytoactinopolyspora halotolerans]|uniref:1-acyl-sn-glycerol-3-phosphate acyltransferase n=1 Tax=Phytoactinopolyspora halotolerans TaxID=1981512 RepID=A0A6L9SDX3_9ACTN|nr:lysophospholipid acyltransferase family protein [Phytoactinopolyspora halotolerans]NEE03343.1 1-acyl-sn-glycerol-3-phosphate acyltransferase [Phytoactinopolyspora halotolerans]
MVEQSFWRDVPGPSARGARLFRPVASAVVRTAWRVRLHGYEMVPRRGPVILAANHTSILDGPLLYGAVRRPVHALTKREMFRGPLGWGLRAIGQIPIDRSCYDLRAVKDCLMVLSRGDVLAIYPEGTRGVGDFTVVRPGVAYLALVTGAPVVPVVGLGVRTSAASTSSLPRLRGNIDLVFGEPIETMPVSWPRRRHVVREHAAFIGEQLRKHVQYALEHTRRDLPPTVQPVP